jgi:hypothetical protein
MKRLLYVLLLVLWLFAIAFPFFAFALAGKGELQMGDENGRFARAFLLNSDEAEGVGFVWAGMDGDCQESTLVYLLWEGDAKNGRYCQCLNADGERLSATEGSCK